MRRHLDVEAQRMRRPGIALDRGRGAKEFGRVILGVGLAAGAAAFFVHPRNHSQSALRMQVKLLQNLGRFHRDHHAGAVVDCARAQIPRIEMSRDHDELFGMFAALQVGDDVVAGLRRAASAE